MLVLPEQWSFLFFFQDPNTDILFIGYEENTLFFKVNVSCNYGKMKKCVLDDLRIFGWNRFQCLSTIPTQTIATLGKSVLYTSAM